MKKLLSTKRFYLWAVLILTVVISAFALNFPSWSTVNAQEFKETSKQTYSNTKNAPRSLNINNQSQSESDIYQSEDPNSVAQIDTTIKKETTKNSTLNSQHFSVNSQEKFQEGFNSIVEEIESQDTDVVTELYKQKLYYENMLPNVSSDKETKKIHSLINATQNLIDDYLLYESGVQTRGGFHLIYSPYIATVIAGFNISGWTLAAELLTHAVDNNNLDSIYNPINTSRVFSSTQFNSIKNSSASSGTSNFTKNNTTAGDDLYYAIHAFYWSKSYSGRTIVIQDRYDYAGGDYGYGSITGTIVELVYQAQQAGVIVPYYSVITYNDDTISAQNSSESLFVGSGARYTEKLVTLGKNEYKEFVVTFASSGNKIFQTFGDKDAYLELYNSNGSRLTYNDDGGYSLNSLLPYYCYANVQYKIRVKFFNPTYQSGEIKLAITPSVGAVKSDRSTLNTFEDIWETNHPNYTFGTFAQIGRSRLFIYKPDITKTYTIETVSDLDTYLYVIDPRLTAVLTNNDYNDDAGSGLNARLNKQLSSNTSYLIVYSTYSITSQSGDLQLKMYR